MLDDLDGGIRSHFQGLLSAIDASFDATTVILSLVDDEKTHRLLAEDNSPIKEVQLPFAICERQTPTSDVIKQHSAYKFANDIVISRDRDANTARTNRIAPIQMRYNIHVYHKQFSLLSDLTEYWMLNLGRTYTIFNITLPELDNEQLDVSLTVEDPESVRPAREDVWLGGLVYRQTFPSLVRTLLVSPSAATEKTILNTVLEIDLEFLGLDGLVDEFGNFVADETGHFIRG